MNTNEEKRITKKEFDEAVAQVMADMAADDDFEGMAKLMVPLTGAMFASKMSAILFKDNKEEE